MKNIKINYWLFSLFTNPLLTSIQSFSAKRG